MRSDLFCTRRQGINASDPISTFSWISFFHLIVSYTVDLSVAEHTTMHPCLEKVYRVHPGGTFLILRWSALVLRYPIVVDEWVCHLWWIWVWPKNRIRWWGVLFNRIYDERIDKALRFFRLRALPLHRIWWLCPATYLWYI